eukprot:268481-Chlamydomonas_euryale.AAC.2
MPRCPCLCLAAHADAPLPMLMPRCPCSCPAAHADAPLPIPPRYTDESRKILKQCYEEVWALLESRREALWAGIKALSDRREMLGEELVGGALGAGTGALRAAVDGG